MNFSRTRTIIAVLLAGLSVSPAWAISEGGAIFLLIRPGARPSGMGSAFSAIANDATATYFNPAGLAYLMPEQIQQISMEDIRDWPRLAADLQDRESFYLFQPQEFIDPASLTIMAGQSPLLGQNDILDWQALLGQESTGSVPAWDKLWGQLGDSVWSAAVSQAREGELTNDKKRLILSGLNRRLWDGQIYNQASAAGFMLSPQVRAMADPAKFGPGKIALNASDIPDPAKLAERLKNSQEPLSRYLWGRFSAEARARLQRGEAAGQALADELNRIIRGKIYQPSRFALPQLDSVLIAKVSLNPKGDQLAALNLRLLEAAYYPELAVQPDYGAMDKTAAVMLNRAVLEACLPGAIKPLGERLSSQPWPAYLKDLMAQPAWDSLRTWPLQESPGDEGPALLAEYFNAALNGYGAEGTEQQNHLPRLKAMRAELEGLYPGMIRSHQDKIRASVQMHLRGLIQPDQRAAADRYQPGRPVSQEEKETLLNALNQLLSNRVLYHPDHFPPAKLSPEAASLVREGVEYLTLEELTLLNRRLLESALPGLIKKRVAPPSRHATLMHSPWFSEIWGDVGDMYYEFIAYAQPVKDWGVFGGNVIFLSEGTNQRIDNDNNVIGTFSSYEFSPTLSYANRIYRNLAGGINLKLIYSHLAPFGAPGEQGKGIATTWAVDLGLLYQSPLEGLALGLNVQNIGPKLTYIDAQEADPLSRNLRVGTAYDILDGKYTKLTAAWDFTKTIVDLSPDRPWKEEIKDVVHHLGMEYWYLGPASLALRGGYVLDEVGNIKGPTYGAGVGYRKIQFDFAMEPGGDLQNFNKKFSLSAVF